MKIGLTEARIQVSDGNADYDSGAISIAEQPDTTNTQPTHCIRATHWHYYSEFP